MRQRAALIGCIAALAGSVSAQNYPVKPVRIVVPQAPGAQSELFARMLGQKLTESLGQPVVTDPRPGAGGAVGAEVAARAAPDGYTLLLATNSTHGSNPAIYTKLPYDAVRDFAPIALMVGMPYVLSVHPSLPVAKVKELIAFAKARPGQLNYASAGNGSTHQLCGELFKTMTGVDIVHVPYKGGPPATLATTSGEVSMLFNTVGSVHPFVSSGKLRALGVTTTRHSTKLPGVPTLNEAGLPGFDMMSWFGLLAPAGTPGTIVVRLNADTNKALDSAEVRSFVAAAGLELIPGTPGHFGDHIKSQIARFSKIAKAAGIRLD
ncbi:MAG: tripartite tricarboxylate transporter substrate binding protein [Burkholderiales bacterium]|nr:tripartite tricarboxylate transporter substrate binding protein [Burkholderiales bacterium]